MSCNESMSNNLEDVNENMLFVKLLGKYKIILERSAASSDRKKQYKARKALTREFNQRCSMNLTLRQIVRKVNNMKARIKEKIFKNSARSKQLPFSEWERKFVELWDGSGLTALKMSSKPNLCEISDPQSVEYFDEIKSEGDKDSLPDNGQDQNTQGGEDGDTPHNTLESFAKANETESESELESIAGVCSTEDVAYKDLSLDQLQRAVLISQMKTLKAQRDTARSMKKLNLYKLFVLQQKNANNS